MKKQIKKLLLLFITLLVTSCNSQVEKSKSVQPKKSISKAISTIPNATIKEIIAYYYKLKNERLDDYNFNNESELNNLGYQYLNVNEVKSAIKIFKLLVSEFPNSANAYDSLGEAYFKDNNLELAKVNYKKSLVINPKNENADKWIFKIDYKTRERPKFNQTFPKQQYLEEIDELAKRLVETHPTPFEFTTKEAFYKLVNSQKEKIKENMIFGEFIWLLTPIQAAIGCEHTQFDQFFIENNMLPIKLRFPIEAELIDSKLLVTKVHQNTQVPLGSTIKSINGVHIFKIIDEVFKHIPTNGHSKALKKATFNRFITAYIPYYLNFPKTYEITLEDSNQSIKLSPLRSFKLEFLKTRNELNFKIKYDNIGILRIGNFSYYSGKKWEEYTSFIDSSFIEIDKKGIKDLVIDIRGNFGGCSCAAIYLLQHISKKPFTYFSPNLAMLPGDKSENKEKNPTKNHFSGNTYIIQDGFNTSTSGHFLAMVKQNSIATLVGEESGASFYSNGNSKQFLGTNTGAFYLIGQTYFEVTANDFPKNRGVLPDHYVYKTPKDIKENKDTQMEYILKLIKQ